MLVELGSIVLHHAASFDQDVVDLPALFLQVCEAIGEVHRYVAQLYNGGDFDFGSCELGMLAKGHFRPLGLAEVAGVDIENQIAGQGDEFLLLLGSEFFPVATEGAPDHDVEGKGCVEVREDAVALVYEILGFLLLENDVEGSIDGGFEIGFDTRFVYGGTRCANRCLHEREQQGNCGECACFHAG